MAPSVPFVYEGVDAAPIDYRGETGAQSSVVPTLVAFLKIPHRPTRLTDHLADMRRFMPAGTGRSWSGSRRCRRSAIWSTGDCTTRLEALATFREAHLGLAREYIARWVDDPRGTGGTPYLEWLGQLIAETRAYKIP